MFTYLAKFRDGSVFLQPKDDLSTIDPTKSAFYDVLQKIDDVVYFEVTDNDERSLSVDLVTGLFKSDGNMLPAHPGVSSGSKLTLVHFRRVKISPQSKTTETEYHIGYDFEKDGKAVRHTVTIR